MTATEGPEGGGEDDKETWERQQKGGASGWGDLLRGPKGIAVSRTVIVDSKNRCCTRGADPAIPNR